MYMPKSATPVGGMPYVSPTQNGYMPKSATSVHPLDQGNSNGPSIGGFLGNLLSSGVNTIGNLANVVRHPIQTAQNLVELPLGEGEAIAQHFVGGQLNPNAPQFAQDALSKAHALNGYMKNRYGGVNQIDNTLYNDPVGAALDVSSVLDGGESLAGTTANVLGDADKLNIAAKTANVLGKASDVTNPLNAITAPVKAGGKLNEILGNAINSAGESMPLRGLRASPSQMTNFAKQTGIPLQQFMNDNNITGNFQDVANEKLGDLFPQYESAATQTGVNVPYATVQKSFQPLLDEWSKSTLPALQGKAADMQGYLDAIKNKYGDKMNVADVLGERQQADAMLKPGNFNTNLSPEQTLLYKNIRDNLKGVIDNATQGKTGDLGKQINQWQTFKDIADRQANLGKGSKPISLTGGLISGGAGTAGAFMGGLPGMAMGMASGPVIDALNSNPRIISAESQALQKVGGGLYNVGAAQGAFANSAKMQQLLKLLRTATSVNGNIQTSQNQ